MVAAGAALRWRTLRVTTAVAGDGALGLPWLGENDVVETDLTVSWCWWGTKGSEGGSDCE